jgi:hypothetical protein
MRKPATRSEQQRQILHVGQSDRIRSLDGVREQKGRAGNQRDSSAEAVHVVEQIECVGHADHPQDREHAVEAHRLYPMKPVPRSQEHRRQRDFRHELRGWFQRDHIVCETDQRDRCRAGNQDRQLMHAAENRNADDNGQRDGDSAKQSRRSLMPAIWSRLRHVSEPVGDTAAYRHERSRGSHGAEEHGELERHHSPPLLTSGASPIC